MSSKWHQKKARQAEFAFEKALQNTQESAKDTSDLVKDSAMGGGDDELFEKKLSKEEKKALAKAKRDAKRKAKQGGGDNSSANDDKGLDAQAVLEATKAAISEQSKKGGAADGIDHEAADRLATEDGTICTYASSRKGVDARARDINVESLTVQHKGSVMLSETQLVLNDGNSYGLIGRNGCGKSVL